MRAAVVTEFGAPLEISDLELPTPGFGEALVRVETSGVCHTDLHAAHGDWPVKPQPPFVPGHEGYGTVVALGTGVRDLEVGDKVGNAWLWSACGSCEYCRTGWETLCESQQNGGYSVNGSFGTYMLVNAAYAPRIPDGVDPLEIAPILCAGVTVYKGLKVTDTRPGQWVAISGIGGLGHIAVQYARAMGLRVVAIDVDDSKLALATRLGAEVVVNARTSDVVAEVQKATGGVHGVLVTAVHPQAFGQAIGSTSVPDPGPTASSGHGLIDHCSSGSSDYRQCVGGSVGIDPDNKLILLCDMDIGAVLLPMGDVVRRRPKKALRGRQVTGHYPRQRVGQASNQATEAGPGRRRRPNRVDKIPARAPTAGAIGFTSHTQPGGNTDPVRPAPGQPPQTLTNGSAPRIGRGLGGPQVGSEDFVADSGRRHAA